jgi:predicted dehydrogenase
LIGKKRALALPRAMKLKVICDVDVVKADALAKEFSCQALYHLDEVLKDKSIEALFICTPNKFAAHAAHVAILAGKHVLIEKPGARNLDDFKLIHKAYTKKKVVVMFGYNHRFHDAMIQAKKIIDSKKYGPILFIRAKYGHGARLGYEKEWRFNKEISGGGHLIDQGTHLIDLVNFFRGEAPYATGRTKTLFWNTALEDAAFLILESKNFIANLTTTCLEWKNVFSFEIMLEKAKIQIDGLGRSYGTEKLTLYIMSKEMGPPKVQEFEYGGEDLSWEKENKEFLRRITKKETGDTSLKEAKYVLDIIKQAYN